MTAADHANTVPACPNCGMTARVSPSRKEPGRWWCDGCAAHFDSQTAADHANTDLAHWTHRMLQALDIYWEHYEGLSYKKAATVRSESCAEDWWFRFEKYRKRVEGFIE